jgi:hypothetical protein
MLKNRMNSIRLVTFLKRKEKRKIFYGNNKYTRDIAEPDL